MAGFLADGELLKKARVKLVLDHPFFGVLLLHLPCVPGPTPFGTAHVDGEKMVYNPEWVRQWDDDERMGLVAHEILHMALGHVYSWRRGRRKVEKWLIATDYVVNLLVTSAGLKIPKGGLLDTQFAGMSVEKVYDLLPDEPKAKAMDWIIEVGSTKKGDDKSSGGSKDDKDGKDKDKGGGNKGKIDSGPPQLTPEEAQALEQKWKGLLVQAATVARQRGKLPSGMEWIVKDVVEPKIPWTQVLENFVNEVLKDDYDMMRPDRRYLSGLTMITDSGVDQSKMVHLPDLYSEGCEVAVAIDTSGSISEANLRDFLSETVAILRSRTVSRVRVLTCDAAVHQDEVVGPMDDLPAKLGGKLLGRGGTSFKPVFKRLEDEKTKPACLIYLTDLYGDFPEEPPSYPVLWVTVSRDVEPPFGWAVKYESQEDDADAAYAA